MKALKNNKKATGHASLFIELKNGKITVTHGTFKTVLMRFKATSVEWEAIFQKIKDIKNPPRPAFFDVSSVGRDDLKSQGYRTKGITDETMKFIASKMGEAITNGDYWSALDYACDYCDIPKLKNHNNG